MKLKLFQKQDLARAALHDGLILSWDTGLGKTWAIYLWLLLKVRYERVPDSNPSTPQLRIKPLKPVLIIAPGDLHQQIAEEGWTRFRIRVVPMDSQATFSRLTCKPGSVMPQLSTDGRPILPAEFYITSYSQLATNGIKPLPNAFEAEDPFALQRSLSLPTGVHMEPLPPPQSKGEPAPDFESVCHFFAWRGIQWKDEYHLLKLHPDDSLKDLERAHAREIEAANYIDSPQLRGKSLSDINAAHALLQNLFTVKPCPRFSQLASSQQAFVIRHFCAERLRQYAEGIGHIKDFPIGPPQEGYVVDKPETDTRLKWRIKCLYQPSLSDLSYNAFAGISIDEGVKMKGEETLVGLAVRSMQPDYRLVLTATPVKNRVPDIFRLAWWATGGKAEAHARFPYRDDSEERAKFASTFMVTERNLTKIANAKANSNGRSGGGGEGAGRFTKLTAEVCNVHRLWKLLGPIVLRRRKDDCGEDIVPKVRKVIRCEMGTHQKMVYQYHLLAEYTDINEMPATGAKLQALRTAAADPASATHLQFKGDIFDECSCCFSQPEMKEGRNDLGEFVEFRHPKMIYLAQEGPRADGEASPAARTAPVSRSKLITHHSLITSPEWNVFCVNGHSAHDSKHDDKAAALQRAEKLSQQHRVPPNPKCRHCAGGGKVKLPHVSGQPYIPKYASTLTLIQEILERQEQCVVFSAFTDPLDKLSGYLSEANVRHVKLDGRTSQKKRGALAAEFKRGRAAQDSPPVMLAGVECMAEGHSFHLANNVILIAYSWAYDKFIQAINRVHRMTSTKPVNVYVVLCNGTIDRKLESLIGDKGDAAELVLDGRLIGERSEEVNLADLLRIAQREFDGRSQTIDEALLQAQWPALRDQLAATQRTWDTDLPAQLSTLNHKPETKMRRTNPIRVAKPTAPGLANARSLQTPAPSMPQPAGDWRARLAARAASLSKTQPADVWDSL